jgi:3-mercaptopyruvate sulfurtransferase SseA
LQGGLDAWLEAKLPVVTGVSNKSGTSSPSTASKARKKAPKATVVDAEFVEATNKATVEKEAP